MLDLAQPVTRSQRPYKRVDKIVDHSVFGLDEDQWSIVKPTLTANFENYHLGRLGRRNFPPGPTATAELSRYNPPVE